MFPPAYVRDVRRVHDLMERRKTSQSDLCKSQHVKCSSSLSYWLGGVNLHWQSTLVAGEVAMNWYVTTRIECRLLSVAFCCRRVP